MATTQVLAIEIKQYVDADGKHQTLVPRLLGQTEAARQAKGRPDGRRWDRDSLLHELETKRGKAESDVARHMFGWANRRGDLRLWFGSERPLALAPPRNSELAPSRVGCWCV